MYARIAAFVLWAAVAAGLMYWLLRVGVSAPALPPHSQPVSTAAVLRGDVARLFADPAAPQEPGVASPAEPGLASRFKLVGVMAPRRGEGTGGQGIALIEVDGKPPRPFRVGRPLDDALVLQSVAARSATIGPRNGAPAVQLEIPLPATPATGTLPPPARGFGGRDGLVPPEGPPGVPPQGPSAGRAFPPAQAPQPQFPQPQFPQQQFPQQLPPGMEMPVEPDRPPVDAGSDEPPGAQAPGQAPPITAPPPGIDPENRR
jgi:general secretion pathway protein C